MLASVCWFLTADMCRGVMGVQSNNIPQSVDRKQNLIRQQGVETLSAVNVSLLLHPHPRPLLVVRRGKGVLGPPLVDPAAVALHFRNDGEHSVPANRSRALERTPHTSLLRTARLRTGGQRGCSLFKSWSRHASGNCI